MRYIDSNAAASAIMDIAERTRSDWVWMTVAPAVLRRLDALVHSAVCQLIREHPAVGDSIKVLPRELCYGCCPIPAKRRRHKSRKAALARSR